MTVIYNAKVCSNNPRIDGLPMELPVGIKITCKIRDADKLKYDATNMEKRWYAEQVVPNIVEDK